MHGGAAPQNRRKAEERLALLVDPALEALADLVDFGENGQVRLRAARAILDYAGFRPHRAPARISTAMLEAELERVNAEIEEMERDAQSSSAVKSSD